MKRLILLACAVFSLSSQAQLTNNLVICMPMDNNLTSDLSGNSNNGTIMGGGVSPTTGHTGVPNTAFTFNGSSYIKVPTSASIDNIETNDELSISIWCKVTVWDPGSAVFPMVERYINTAPSGDGWQFNLLNGASFGSGDVDFGNGLAMLGIYDGNSPVPTGGTTWRHYAMVYSQSGNYCKLYVNGALLANHTLSSPTAIFNTSHGDIRIGFSQAGVDEYANGAMDDLRVYSCALTATEVYWLYADPSITCSSESSDVDPPVNTGCCLGNSCNDADNALLNDYKIPMAGYNFNYTMPQSSPSKVLIGKTNCGTGFARLDVTDDFIGNGIKGYCATNRPQNIGVYGTAEDLHGKPNVISIGVMGDGGQLLDQTRQYGVAGFCGGAVIPAMPPMPQSVGIYGNSTANGGTWAGYFDGDVNINGNVNVNGSGVYSGTWTFSDKRFKANIKEIENISERISKLKAYTYDFKTEEFKSKNFEKGKQIGFIAQELQEVFPELVKEDKSGYLAVNYQGMVPVLLQALKEQNELNQSQQKQIEELKNLVNKTISNNSSNNKTAATTGIAVNLSDKNAIVLNQNVPNPFAESTVITYNIPSDFAKAQIIFMTNDGRLIKAVDIKEKGQGSLNVFADDLTNGIYSYMLVIDGKTVDTKKMVKN